MDNFLFSKREPFLLKLDELNTEPDTSYALVFLPERVGEPEMKRLNEARRICDRVIVATQEVGLTEAGLTLLQKSGVDAVYAPEGEGRLCTLDTGVKDCDGTFVLQVVLAVMPNLVLINRDDLPLLRTLRNIQQTFGELFSLREIR